MLANALLDFYQKILQPEFDAIKGKLAEHDQRFDEMVLRTDRINHRLGGFEEQLLIVNNNLSRIEVAIKLGNP